jgi:hypothetical protein
MSPSVFDMQSGERDRSLWIATAAFALVCLLLYLPAMDRWVVGDDMRNHVWATTHGFNITLNEDRFFRPLENLVNAANTWLLGPDRNALNFFVALFGLVASAHFVMRLARRVYPESRTYPFLAGGYFALNSLAVGSVIQMDTISQQYATVFTLAACTWMMNEPPSRSRTHLVVTTLLLLLALSSKESALAVVAVLPLVMVLLQRPNRPFPLMSRTEIVGRLGITLLAFGIYIAARIAIGTKGWGDHGSLNAAIVGDPLHWIKQSIVMLAPLFYIGSTLDLFPWASPLRIGLSVALTSILMLCAGLGIRTLWSDSRAGRIIDRPSLRAPLGLLLLMGATLFPAVVTDHVSETWTYGPLPFASLLFWLLISRGWGALRAKHPAPVWRALAVGYLCIAAGWMAFGLREKVDLAVAISNTSARMFREASEIMGASPARSFTFCVSDDINANGETLPGRVGGSEVGSDLYRMQARVSHYNIFYDGPSEVLSYLLHYLRTLHSDREIRVKETSDCIRLSPFETSGAGTGPDAVNLKR